MRRRLDPAGAGAQRVDVEAGVELVEDGDARLEHRELQRLVALLLAARQVDVERPVEEALVEADARRLGDAARLEPVGRVGPGRRSASVSTSSRRTPGTSVGYCMARYSPAAARSHGGRASTSTPSSVTEPPSTS